MSSMKLDTSEFDKYFDERFKRLLDSDHLSDCEFKVGDEKLVVKGHKLLFASASPVFNAMFFGELSENACVVIKDLESAGFLGMKNFIYTNEIKFKSAIHACQVYVAARKYIIPPLCHLSSSYLGKNIYPNGALEVFEYSKHNEISGIDTICTKIFKEQTRAVMESAYFLRADIETLKIILNLESLNLRSEGEVFKYSEMWIAAEVKRREQNGIAVDNVASEFNCIKKLIRFLTMTGNEFTSGPARSFLLTTEEKLAISLNLLEYNSANYPGNLGDKRNRRQFTAY